jgi:hypothetical protein
MARIFPMQEATSGIKCCIMYIIVAWLAAWRRAQPLHRLEPFPVYNAVPAKPPVTRTAAILCLTLSRTPFTHFRTYERHQGAL